MVYEVTDTAAKRRIAADVLADLPEWFGIPESAAAYIRESEGLPFFSFDLNGQDVGFVCLKKTSPCTAELCVMGVKKAYHRQGIGRKLVEAFMSCAQAKGYQYAQVRLLLPGAIPSMTVHACFTRAWAFARWRFSRRSGMKAIPA